MRDINKWLTSFVRSTLELKEFKDGVTVDFLTQYMNFTCVEKDWCSIPIEAQKRLVRLELRKLERKLVAYEVANIPENFWFLRTDANEPKAKVKKKRKLFVG